MSRNRYQSVPYNGHLSISDFTWIESPRCDADRTKSLEEILVISRYSLAMELLHLFKGLADPIRLRIAHLLTQKDELCVCHLTDALSLPQSTVSRHLNILRNSGLVEAERRGKWVYYRMLHADAHVHAIAELIRNSAVADDQLQQDLENLKESIC